MDTSVLERIQVEILTNIPKTNSRYAPLTGELDILWDDIVVGFEKIKAAGGIMEVAYEIPDVEVLPNIKMGVLQPRNPAGSSAGGQWGGGSGSSGSLEATARGLLAPAGLPAPISTIGGAAQAYGAQFDSEGPEAMAIMAYTTNEYREINHPLKENPELLDKLVTQGHEWPPRPENGYTYYQRVENHAEAVAVTKEILRAEGLPPLKAEALSHAKPLHDAIAAAPSFPPTVVHRGFREGQTGPTIAEFKQAAADGQTLKVDGFISTSRQPQTAFSFATDTSVLDGRQVGVRTSDRHHKAYVTEIVARKGLVITNNMQEGEVILQHGSRFKVLGVTQRPVDLAFATTSVRSEPITVVQLLQLD